MADIKNDKNRTTNKLMDGGDMAARLTDKQKKKIVADYLELGSYNATAKKNSVTHQTVKRVVQESSEISEKLQQKKEENTADIIAYMEEQRQRVCDIIEVGLRVLPEKIADARTASEVTTAIGTLIDKWTDAQKKLPMGEGVQIIDDL